MAASPSSIALYSDFAGGAGSPFPSGWEAGLYSGESGWQLDGSGNLTPSAVGWRSAATTAGFTRGSTAGGIVAEFSTIPSSGMVTVVFLPTVKTLDAVSGYQLRWDPGTDFQMQRRDSGGTTYLDGVDQTSITGTIQAGFKIALMADSSGVTAYVSTDGGSNWQQVATSTDTTHTGTMYGGIESNATSGVPELTNVWLGLNGSGAPATIAAGAIASAFSGTAVAPTIPTHVAGDVIVVVASKNDAATLSLSGWTAIGTPENNANLSTGAWYKIAASGSETASVSSSTSATAAAGLYAQAFVADGTLYGAIEDATWNGSPTTSTTPASSTITTTQDDGLGLAVALIDAGGAYASGLPPSGWTTLADVTADGLVVPTILAGALTAVTDAASPYQCTPTLPAHQADDILVVVCGAGSAQTWTCPTSGWAEVAAAQNNANFSTGWFWKRATSAAEANPVCTAAASLTLGGYAVAFRVRGCVASGTPFEDATLGGSPTSNTTPASSVITTTGAQRLAVAIAQIEDNNTISNYPPATWTGVYNNGSNTGDDWHANIIAQTVPVAGDVAAVNVCSQNAADYWKTLTLAFIPKVAGAGRITSIKKDQPTAGDLTGVTIGTLSSGAYWKTLALGLIPPIPVSTRLKRWNGSTWVAAVHKAYVGGAWVDKPWKTT